MTSPGGAQIPKPVSTRDPVSNLLRDLVHERIGLNFDPDRISVMLEKLEPLAAAQGCPTYLDYYYLLKYDSKADGEWNRLMDAFSVQETFFWREVDQVKALVDHVIPEWFGMTSRPFQIWSAACASGEEPYTIAMAIAESKWARHPIEIHASDASEAALKKAHHAVYRERSFRALPTELRSRYFTPVAEGSALRTDLLPKVHFRRANLMNEQEFADLKDLYAIFCRNVFIYFSPASIGRAAAAFGRLLPARGRLFIGASESLLKITDRFHLEEEGQAFVYVNQPHHAS